MISSLDLWSGSQHQISDLDLWSGSLVWINTVNTVSLQASSSEAMGRWLGVLLAETGSTTDPATLHYDYIDVETTANIIQLAKQSFW